MGCSNAASRYAGNLEFLRQRLRQVEQEKEVARRQRFKEQFEKLLFRYGLLERTIYRAKEREA